MTNLSLAVRTKEASVLRRWHKHVKISLGRIAKKAYSKPPVRDIHRDNEYNMQRIVSVFVQVRLEEILYAARQDYPHIRDAKQLIARMAFRKVTFISEGEIYVLSLLMTQTRQESHYSTAKISSFIVRSFNKNRGQYGVVAVMDFDDIVIVADPERSRREILDSFDET